MSIRNRFLTSIEWRESVAVLRRARAIEQATFGNRLVARVGNERAHRSPLRFRLGRLFSLVFHVVGGVGCPSVGGQRGKRIHRSCVGLSLPSLALPVAKPVCGFGSGIGFAHAGGAGSLRLQESPASGCNTPNPSFNGTCLRPAR